MSTVAKSVKRTSIQNGDKGGGTASQVRRKRKVVSSGGQKWFKGSPRKSRPPALPPPSFSASAVENPPSLPPAVVHFALDGGFDIRLSVYELLSVSSKSDTEDEAPVGITSSSKNRNKKKSISKTTEPEKKEDNVEETRPLPQPMFVELDQHEERYQNESISMPNAYIRWMDRGAEDWNEDVEYDVDEEDVAWLESYNKKLKDGVRLQDMELLMDRLEKESYLQMQSTGMDQRPVIDDDAVCCICMDGECQNSNAILFCDMCNLAVHQECYGVPYIPEGQWLCRRCLQSPSRAVDCVLCPNKGGAFKQTDDGRWAHVVCAIWIPEVCFANTVFLEPVDSVNNIPPARWRLCCFICKYKGKGACIQCHKSNCYIAFHVTCAQYAGLCMKMDTVRIGSTVTVRKTAYCDNHAPPEFIRSRDSDSPSVRQKLKACRKMLAEKRSAMPTVSVPTIPPDRLSEITSMVSFPRKAQFIKRLLAYWKLKRIKRNGVPLLRRLQAASNHPPSTARQQNLLNNNSRWQADYKYLLRLRQDLEKARLLCELIRKRERQKRELVTLTDDLWSFQSNPLSMFLTNVIDELAARDPHNIFAEPVDPEAVPDYYKVITQPMDLSTMRQKAQNHDFNDLKGVEVDFQRMIDNCLLYNAKDTIFYRSAIKFRDTAGVIFREAYRMADQIGFDYQTGLHVEDYQYSPSESPETDKEIAEEIDAFLNDSNRLTKTRIEQISDIERLIDKCIRIKHPVAKKNKYVKLQKEQKRLRKQSESNATTHSVPKRSERSPSPKPASPRMLRRKSSAPDEVEEHIRFRSSKLNNPESKSKGVALRRSSRCSVSNSVNNPPLEDAHTESPSRTLRKLDSRGDQVPNSVLRRNPTRLSNGIGPIPTTPKNGRLRSWSPSSRKSRISTPRLPPPASDSFRVYREAEKESSDVDEEDEPEDNDEEGLSEEDSMSGDESDSGSSTTSSDTSYARIARDAKSSGITLRQRDPRSASPTSPSSSSVSEEECLRTIER